MAASAHGGDLRVACLRQGPGDVEERHVNFVLTHVFQELRHPVQETPAAPSRRTERAARRPRLPRTTSGTSDPPLLSSVQPAGDSAARAGREGNTVSMKQKKKKAPNKGSGTNGDGKTSEKPAPDEAPPSAEAQASVGFLVSFLGANLPECVVWVCEIKALKAWQWSVRDPDACHSHVLSITGRAAGAGAGMVCGTARTGSQDTETHPEAE